MWNAIPGCLCPWCTQKLAPHDDRRVRLDQFPWPVRGAYGLARDDVTGSMETVPVVWAGIQLPDTRDTGRSFHVFASKHDRKTESFERMVRDLLGVLLIHEVDEGLEVGGRRCFDAHGADRDLSGSVFRRLFLGGTI